jgi:hypothetical protein
MNLITVRNAGIDEEQIVSYGCSLYSNYIPVYALYKQSLSEFFTVKDSLAILYNKFRIKSTPSKNGRYDALFAFWDNYISPMVWKSKEGVFLAQKYFLSDGKETLACICLNSKIDFRKIDKANPDKNNFIFLINKNFKTKYKNLWSKFSREIINDSDLDLLFTDNIEKHCFQMQRFIPKFRNIQQMNEYCKSVNNLLCLKERKLEQEQA